jgi:hypothetical protein
VGAVRWPVARLPKGLSAQGRGQLGNRGHALSVLPTLLGAQGTHTRRVDPAAGQPSPQKGRNILEVTNPIRDTYLVHAQRPAWGKNESSGVAVYHFKRSDTWECERCGTAHGTSNPECLHVRCVKESIDDSQNYLPKVP